MSEIPKASLIMFDTRFKPVLEWSRPLARGNKTQLGTGNNPGEKILLLLTLLIEFTS